jgi:tetratricopeptide (TPR) repeat protein
MTSPSERDSCAALDAMDRGCRVLRNNRLTQAERFFTQALALRPRWHDALQRRALVRHERRYYRGAIADYRKALQSCPECHWCWGYLADVHRDAGDPRSAKKCLDRAILLVSRKDPTPQLQEDCAQYRLDRGRTQLALGQTRQALHDFDVARRNRGLGYLATLGRGRALALIGRWSAALKELNDGVRVHPEDDEARMLRGIVRLLDKDRRGGMEDLKRIRTKRLRIALLKPGTSLNSKALRRLLHTPFTGR